MEGAFCLTQYVIFHTTPPSGEGCKQWPEYQYARHFKDNISWMIQMFITILLLDCGLTLSLHPAAMHDSFVSQSVNICSTWNIDVVGRK